MSLRIDRSKTNVSNSCNLPILTIVFLLIGYLSGCASINPGPFEEYRDAFLEMQSSADAVLAMDYEWTYKKYIQEIKEGDNAIIENLLLTFPDEGYYLWGLPSEPLFIKIKRTQQALTMLNSTFAEYTSLLAQLSSGSLVDVKIFEQLTKELYKNAISAAKELNLSSSEKQIALFSTISAEAARLYMEKRRKEDLIKVISENQETIDLFSKHAIGLIKLMAVDMKAEYNKQTKSIVLRWQGKTGRARIKVIKELLEINSQVIAQLEVLRSLEQSYTIFSRKHRELGDAISNGTLRKLNTSDMINIAKRLNRMYKKLAKTK